MEYVIGEWRTKGEKAYVFVTVTQNIPEKLALLKKIKEIPYVVFEEDSNKIIFEVVEPIPDHTDATFPTIFQGIKDKVKKYFDTLKSNWDSEKVNLELSLIVEFLNHRGYKGFLDKKLKGVRKGLKKQ